jgi:hypothetical protein
MDGLMTGIDTALFRWSVLAGVRVRICAYSYYP